MIRRRVVAHGRVQGVFFRDTIRRAAEQRGVTGLARNVPDGTVEAVFEGEPDAVESMVSWSRSGPSRAEVSRVDVDDAEPELERVVGMRAGDCEVDCGADLARVLRGGRGSRARDLECVGERPPRGAP